MDIETVGSSAGSGVLAAVLTWLGFKQRLDRADADISELKKAVMYKDTHEVCAAAHRQQLTNMDQKLDYIIGRMDSRK